VGNLFDLTGTTALITGSSRGIGLAIARALLEQGAAVLVNGYASDETSASQKVLAEEFPEIGLLAPLAPSWLESVVGLLGWGARVGTRRLSLVSLLGSAADPAAAVAGWLAPAVGQVGPDALSLLADLLAGDGALAGVVEGEGTPEHPFEVALSSDGTGPTLAIWFPPAGPSALLTVAGDELVRWRPGAPGLATDALVQALEAEALVAADVADLVWNRNLSGGLDGLVARWSGGDGRIVPPLNPPAGVDVVTLEDLAAGQVDDALDLADLLDHAPPVTFHVRIAASADDPATAVVLLDVVLGYGSHPDPASELAPVLQAARRQAARAGRELIVIGSMCGTIGDPQGLREQEARLSAAGALLAPSNAGAARLAILAARTAGARPTGPHP
jgi:NAD(P)-dependent dehydrogenase (short-subunit alcohol dehydrogenase family)